jgi:hypothetical protein
VRGIFSALQFKLSIEGNFQAHSRRLRKLFGNGAVALSSRLWTHKFWVVLYFPQTTLWRDSFQRIYHIHTNSSLLLSTIYGYRSLDIARAHHCQAACFFVVNIFVFITQHSLRFIIFIFINSSIHDIFGCERTFLPSCSHVPIYSLGSHSCIVYSNHWQTACFFVVNILAFITQLNNSLRFYKWWFV